MADASIEKKIELRVIAPTMATDKSPYKFQKAVDMVILRATTGDIGILPGRVPVSMVLQTGVLRIFDEDTEKSLAVLGNGVAHVADNIVTVLADGVLKPSEIDTEAVTAEQKELQAKHDETHDLSEKTNLKKDIYRCKIQLEVAATEKK
jgi:F-type H+-transporting ATPase subunit epsilon